MSTTSGEQTKKQSIVEMDPASVQAQPRKVSNAAPIAGGRRTSLAPRKSIWGRPSLGVGSDTNFRTKKRAPVLMENTYRLEPYDEEHFSASRVKEILDKCLKNYLNDQQYEYKKCTQLVRKLTDIIREKIKDLGFVRYKLVVVVHIGQKIAEDNTQLGEVTIASRSVWSKGLGDNFAESTFQNATLFAVATVLGAYFE